MQRFECSQRADTFREKKAVALRPRLNSLGRLRPPPCPGLGIIISLTIRPLGSFMMTSMSMYWPSSVHGQFFSFMLNFNWPLDTYIPFINRSVIILDKKLIRRWDSERELSLRRHRARKTKYNRLVHKFRHRSTRLCVGTHVYQIQWNNTI